MRNLIFISALVFIFSCQREPVLQENVLAEYIELNSNLEAGDIIACAGGKEGGLFGIANEPTSVFFLPVEGATDFRYYEAENVSDSLDFSKYFRKDLVDEPIFNGFLRKFNNLPFTGERMGVVTYRTPGMLHTCTPIRQKTTIKPTEVNADLATVIENGVTPTFNWEDGMIKENVIYFHAILDQEENLISGTYTFDRHFQFYDLSNVVLNVSPTTRSQVLQENANYKFVLMGVSIDNWVNLIIAHDFDTN